MQLGKGKVSSSIYVLISGSLAGKTVQVFGFK